MDAVSLLTMRWCESGLRGIVPPTRKGFGHFGFVDMIAAVMDAEVEVDFREDGL